MKGSEKKGKFGFGEQEELGSMPQPCEWSGVSGPPEGLTRREIRRQPHLIAARTVLDRIEHLEREKKKSPFSSYPPPPLETESESGKREGTE